MFELRWRAPQGQEFTTKYLFDGCGAQKGYTLKGWKLRCIAFGKREGFTYLGQGEVRK